MNMIQKVLKRCLDIVFSLIALVLLSPVFVILSVWIILDDGLPVFFKQKRSGQYNQVFYMYKFRSMKNKPVHVSKESQPYEHWVDGVPDDFVFKTVGDSNPNVTQSGEFLRKYSLDELPQFFNVLIGNMSIVGPRPEIIPITEKYNEQQQKRLCVKPGITGWAQINGRSEMDHGQKMSYDYFYVKHQSFLLDIKILWKTVIHVFTGKGSV